jgi:biopolymer transport protein ExbB
METRTALERYVLDGGFMMMALVPVALLMIAFAVQGFINLRRERVCPRDFSRRLDGILRDARSRPEIVAALAIQHSSIAVILARVLEHLDFKADADPAEVLRERIEEECASLQQRNNQLAAIYNVAPLLGLLGTVFGMLTTFAKFANSPDPSVRELSEGINIALITTAWGLSIAIPAFVFLYVFSRRIASYEAIVLPHEGHLALQKLLLAVGFQRSTATGILKMTGKPPVGTGS